ncbi:MAG: c-type cytochrome [Bacteroidota bacterium]
MACTPSGDHEFGLENEGFHLDSGFRLELVAAAPMLKDPVAMTFDEDGRMWVIEMNSYMMDVDGSREHTPNGRILILEDQNEDGIMDHSTVFMSGLVLPRAIAIVKEGILYAEPPNLWFVENIEDQAGEKILIDSKYAAGGNVEHQPNGMMRGLDNWYYNSKSTARYRYLQGEWIKDSISFRGQWGMSMDDYGRLVYSSNSNHLQGDYVLPGTIERNPNYRPKHAVAQTLNANQQVFPASPTPGVNRGYREGVLDDQQRLTRFTGASGPMVYRGDHFPKEYQGNAFTPEPTANLIKRNILTEEGVEITGTFAYQDREFVSSTHETFRPVSLYNGPDGGMYIVDMGRGIVQHRNYVTLYLRKQILSRRLDTVVQQGRIYRLEYENGPTHRNPRLSEKSSGELVELFSHPNGWWRDIAQRLLVERKAWSVVPQLRQLLQPETEPLTQLHALWTLEGLHAVSLSDLQKITQSKDPRVVASGIQIAEQLLDRYPEEIMRLYESLGHDPSVRVQLQLASSLGIARGDVEEWAYRLLVELARKHQKEAVMIEAILSGLAGKEEAFQAYLQRVDVLLPALEEALQTSIAESLKPAEEKGPIMGEMERQYFNMGKSLYSVHCSGCHNPNGKGRLPLGPPLRGADYVTGPAERLASVILQGLTGPVTVGEMVYQPPDIQPMMPGLKNNPALDDLKIGAIMSYVRISWGKKDEGFVHPDVVSGIRETIKDRTEPYTEKELLGGT